MSEAALVLLCLGSVLLLAGIGLALWNRSNGGARGGRGRWFAVVLLVVLGAGAILLPLVSLYLVSRL